MKRCVTVWKIFGGALAATFIPLCIVALYNALGPHAVSDALIFAGPAAVGLAIFIASDTRQKKQEEQEEQGEHEPKNLDEQREQEEHEPKNLDEQQEQGEHEPKNLDEQQEQEEHEPKNLDEQRDAGSAGWRALILLALAILLIWTTLLAAYLLTPVRR